MGTDREWRDILETLSSESMRKSSSLPYRSGWYTLVSFAGCLHKTLKGGLTGQEAAKMMASASLQASVRALLSEHSPTTASFLPAMFAPQICNPKPYVEPLTGVELRILGSLPDLPFAQHARLK